MEEIAAVYARSLFEVAQGAGQAGRGARAARPVRRRACERDRELQVFFFSPYFSTPEKQDGLDRAVTGADETIVNFLKLLIENHRMPVIFRVRRGYDELWEEENKLLPVQVTSAVELDEATVEQIGDRIAEQTGRKVDLSASVEPDILGGIVVRVGNSCSTPPSATASNNFASKWHRALRSPHADQARRDHLHPQVPHRGARRRPGGPDRGRHRAVGRATASPASTASRTAWRSRCSSCRTT